VPRVDLHGEALATGVHQQDTDGQGQLPFLRFTDDEAVRDPPAAPTPTRRRPADADVRHVERRLEPRLDRLNDVAADRVAE
jgi:hypothetical protein